MAMTQIDRDSEWRRLAGIPMDEMAGEFQAAQRAAQRARDAADLAGERANLAADVFRQRLSADYQDQVLVVGQWAYWLDRSAVVRSAIARVPGPEAASEAALNAIARDIDVEEF